MKRILRLIMIVPIISGLTVSMLACASGSSESELSETRLETIQRGDITIDITAVGNLVYSDKEELIFEVGGTVAEVLAEMGDYVEEGQALAELDILEWEKQLSVFEDQVTMLERQVTSAQRQLTSRERDLPQVEINVINADIALEQTQSTYTVADFEVAQAKVDEDKRNLDEALRTLAKYEPGSSGYEVHQQIVLQAQAKVNTDEAQLDAMLSGFDTDEVAIKKLQVEIAQGMLDDALIAIGDAQIAVGDAQKALTDAEEELNEARNDNPTITAPFAGLITTVNVAIGDVVNEGHVAIVLADTTKIEAEILVNEMDIFDVRLGAQVSILADALPGVSLGANVTWISPNAIIQAGVVNYKVVVDLAPLTVPESLIPSGKQEQVEPMLDDINEALDKAIKEGRISQEQASTMKERLGLKGGGLSQEQVEQLIESFIQARGNVSPEQKEQFRGRLGEETDLKRQAGGITQKAIQLREGLTVTVSIIVQESNDVILVPNQAIMGKGKEIYVQVLEDGVVEERSITIGISNWQHTEVIGGLSEGEKVIIPETTGTTSATQKPGGVMPNIGRIIK
ncbi:efflux RND transporter periplasmic adaptor subunit [Chloroflexota bacterium]